MVCAGRDTLWFLADELYSRSFRADGWLISSRQWWYYCLETVKFLELQKMHKKQEVGSWLVKTTSLYSCKVQSQENDASYKHLRTNSRSTDSWWLNMGFNLGYQTCRLWTKLSSQHSGQKWLKCSELYEPKLGSLSDNLKSPIVL